MGFCLKKVNEFMRYALGVDLGGTKILAGIILTNGEIHEVHEVPTPQTLNGQDILNSIDAVCSPLIQKYQVSAAGIGTPGLVSFPEGQILGCTPNLQDWEQRNLKEYFGKKWGLPVVVDNDANMATYGEWKIGKGLDLSSFVLLTLGTGLGSGCVMGGRLLRGHGELGVGWGHMIIEKQGRWCNCGQRGCLETYVSGKGLVKTFLLLGGQANVHGPEIFDLALKGHQIAQQAVDLTLDYLAVGLVNLLNGWAPQSILLGGGMSRQNEKILIKPLRKKVKGIMSMPFRYPEMLQIASLGSEAGMVGAGLMALEETFGGK